MIRPLLVGIALLVSTPLVLARDPMPASVPGARALPMQFEWRREGPEETCGKQCRTWISAVGSITADTPREFESFAQDQNLRGATMVLDSEGGSVLGALALGRQVRRLGMTTTVGRTMPAPGSSEANKRFALSHDAYCESMCTFVLLAGTRRYVPAEAHVLVHQIWLGDRRNDAMAANYTAEDLVLVQRDIGRLAQYTVEMGGSIDLLETALKIPPWEPMRALTADEMQQMRLATVDTLFEKAGVEGVTNAAPTTAPIVASIRRPTVVSERGWQLVRETSAPTVVRRHPLTIEGEPIGHFDLVLGCGPEKDSYSVAYMETRRGRSLQRPSRLKEVSLSIRRQNVPLTIDSSDVARGGHLTTVARGVLPTRLAIALSESDSRSVTVATVSGNGGQTSIRVGNTGVADALPKLAAACSEMPASRSTHAGL